MVCFWNQLFIFLRQGQGEDMRILCSAKREERMGRRKEQRMWNPWGGGRRWGKLFSAITGWHLCQQSSLWSAVPRWVKSRSLAAICGSFCSHDTRTSPVSPSTGLAAPRPLTARRRKRVARNTSETGKCASVIRGVSAPAKRVGASERVCQVSPSVTDGKREAVDCRSRREGEEEKDGGGGGCWERTVAECRGHGRKIALKV